MLLKKYFGKTARLAAVVTGLGWFLLYIGVLLNSLYAVGTDAKLFYRLQIRADVLAQAPIDQDRLLEIDTMMADYLSGNSGALCESPFNADELLHMEDCYRLFRLLDSVRCCITGIGVLLIAMGIGIMGYRGIAAERISALCLWVSVIGIAIWAVIDFYGLFTVFHRLLFTNDLWLMDPAKDLMIRICPEEMFETMAAIIAAITLTFTLVADIMCQLIGRNRRRK